MSEKLLFTELFLKQGRFPILDKRGKAACQHEIGLWGFRQFLEDGWSTIGITDEVLKAWLEKMIKDSSQGKLSIDAEVISRSLRYGASLVYYPLFLQTENSNSEFDLPKASLEQEKSLMFDLKEEEVQAFGIFLDKFDPELAAVIGGAISNPTIIRSLSIDQKLTYQGIYFTYFVLANKAEADGMKNTFS